MASIMKEKVRRRIKWAKTLRLHGKLPGVREYNLFLSGYLCGLRDLLRFGGPPEEKP
jgi:hypothetical protein